MDSTVCLLYNERDDTAEIAADGEAIAESDEFIEAACAFSVNGEAVIAVDGIA